MNRYTFEKIVKRMADQFGTIQRGDEEPYNPLFFIIESNALKVHRNNPKANSRSFREALLLALNMINLRLADRQDDLSSFETKENRELLHALLYAFDPYENEELADLVKKDAATHADADVIDDYPSDYLRLYYAIPIRCMIRLVESIDTWEKMLGSNGYFKSIEGTIGKQVKKDDNELNTAALLLYRPVAAEDDPLAYFVTRMLRVWEVPNEDEEAVASTFLELWPKAKEELKAMDVHKLDEVVVGDDEGDLSIELFNIIQTMDMYLSNTRRYAELISYCDDILDLFPDDESLTRLHGIKGEAIHDDGRRDEAYQYFEELLASDKDEEVVASYTWILMADKEYVKAREVLRGFENSTDDLIQERIKWLRREAPEVW